MSTHDQQTPTYTAESLPDGFKDYPRKITFTSAVRIDGPFRVETPEGPLDCSDGWLAVDVNGHPYPIAADVFEQTFHPTPMGEPRGGSAWTDEDLGR